MKNKVVAVYLAAGQSKRMGCEKLSLKVDDQCLGSMALKSLLSSNLDTILVITKKNDDLSWFEPSFLKNPYLEKWKHIICEDAELGIAHSIRIGIQTAMSFAADAVLVMLADQPFVSPTIINKLIETNCERSGEKLDYAAVEDNGIAKPPILFLKQAFPTLLNLFGDEGARRFIQEGTLNGIKVDFNDLKLFIDVDTKQDYEQLLGQIENSR
jgi:molybdenum cofactor cytidylyltransferase